MFYSYYVNLEDFTAYVMLMSNIADIFFNLARFLRDAAYSDTSVILFYISVVISWVVTRLVGLPRCFWEATQRAYHSNPFDKKFDKMW